MDILHSPVVFGVALLLYAALEYALPRTKKVAARSVIEGAINIIGMVVPGVRERFGSPVDQVSGEINK